MTKLTDLTIAAALKKLRAKEIKATELAAAHIDAQAKCRELNLFITETPEQAMIAAKASDARYASGTAKKLDGIVIGNKDLFCTAGTRTTAASKILENFVPPYESTVSQNLLNAGTVSIGKLNLDQFAMGSANVTSAFGPVISPWSGQVPSKATRKLVPGGSSGGSAAAVAARCVMGATATDTGGSIRQPAAFTGIAGIKPTYGRCSRFGIVAFASSLDQAGPVARTVEDCALLLEAMAGFDEKDSTSINRPVPNYAAALTGDVKGLKIGIPREYKIDGTPAEINAAWDKAADMLRAAGAEIVDVSLPHTKYGMAVYYIIAPAEASSNLARYDGVRYGLRVDGKDLTEQYEKSRAAGFGAEVQRRIMLGTYVLSAGYYDAYYLKAQKVRARIAADFETAFQQVDLLLTPAAPSAAFAIGENDDDPIKMYLNDVFTIPTSLAGLPGMAVPIGMNAENLPLGVQIIGRHFEEDLVLKACHVIEQAVGQEFIPPFVA